MALHLVTGYAGVEHVTANDQGSFQMATYSSGEFVLKRGELFEASVLSNNSVQIKDGEALMQGRYIKLALDSVEQITIENGTQGKKRNDLICIKYERNTSTGVESATMEVVKGTESTGTPEDPEITKGDITDSDDELNYMPLYRVKIDGLNITSIEKLFSVKLPMIDNDFALINKQVLNFSNRQCRIDDDRITADSIADVYFTADCTEDADEAYISVDTYDGYIILSAEKTPGAVLTATIFIRAVV